MTIPLRTAVKSTTWIPRRKTAKKIGLPSLWVENDRSVLGSLPVSSRDDRPPLSCPGLHPTVDRLVVACGPPDWVGALKRVQGESCPGLHPTVDPLAGWPKASDEHVLKQTALTPSFARGSRLQTTPKGRKAKAT